MLALDKILNEKRIADVVNLRLIQAPSDTSIKEAVELMRKESSAYIVVTDDTRVVGMMTETDVCRKILNHAVDWTAPLKDYMTPTPVVLRPDDTVAKAIALMAEQNVYHIPLIDERQRLVGVLSVRTLIRFLAEFYPSEIYNLPPDPHQLARSEEGG
jgi:CBS domain-containing protein